MFDPIATFWILLWAGICPYGIYLIATGNKQASLFYVYGKSLDLKRHKKKGLFWNWFLLPKRYFVHFYWTASLVFLTSLATTITYYIPTSSASTKLTAILYYILNLISSTQLKFETTTDLSQITALFFTLLLMTIQVNRRLYECLFISVYSNESKINVIHYLFGHVFYLAAAISTLCPILFSNTSFEHNLTDLLDHLVTVRRAIAFVLFIYASHHQHKCHIILANLRKDKTGRVITEQHYSPSGGPFEYVSCPHFLIEIILYFLILVVQEFSNKYWNLIFMLVLSTQTIKAITDHNWYKQKYRDYPKHRRAIIPGLL